MIASYSPDDASRLATSGSSNAPGAHTSVIDPSSTPWRTSPSRAPDSNRSVMRSLKRAQTSATRRPSPRSMPLYEVIESFQEVSHAVTLGAQVVDVLRVRDGVERDPLHDLQAESVEAAVLGRVVGHVAHRRDAEVDQDLCADAVLATVDGEAEVEVGVDRVTA